MSVSFRGLSIAIFFIVLVSTAYFHQGPQPNTNSRFNLIQSLLDDQSIQIDRFSGNTIDKAFREGHYYSDKAPGLSFLGTIVLAPFHVLFNAIDLQARTRLQLELYLVTFFLLNLLTAISAVFFFRLSCELLGPKCVSLSFAVTLLSFLSTLALPYSTTLFSSQLTANLLFLSFYHLRKFSEIYRSYAKTIFLAFIISYICIVEYPAAPVAAIFGAYLFIKLLQKKEYKLATISVVPGIFILCLILFYNYHAFGSAFSIGYSHLQLTPFYDGMAEGFFGLKFPTPERIYQLLFSSYRGLFFFNPILFFSLLGLLYGLYISRFRNLSIIISGLFLYFLFLNASYYFWEGGACIGPRHLVPVLPFLLVALLLLPKSWILSPLFWTTGLVSFIFMIVSTTVNVVPSEDILNPLWDYLFPQFRSGNISQGAFPLLPMETIVSDPTLARMVSFNLGELVGLRGISSILPLIVIIGGVSSSILYSQIRNYLKRFCSILNSNRNIFYVVTPKEMIIISFVLLLILFILYPACEHHQNGNIIKPWIKYVFRPFLDTSDYGAYMQRGSWSVHNLIPYKDVFAEYPIIPVLVFGAISFISSVGENISPFLTFAIFFICLNVFQWSAFNGLIHVVRKVIFNGVDKFAFILVLLPATIYFGFNRFDLLITAGVGFFIFLIFREKYIVAGVLLAILSLTKWTPILLMPAVCYFLLYQGDRTRKLLRFCASTAVMFFIIAVAGILWCGKEFFTVPMLWQMSRDPSFASLPYLLQRMFTQDESVSQNIFMMVLPFMGVFIPLIMKCRNKISLLFGMLVIFHWFVLFSKVYSPQWILWDLGIWIFVLIHFIGIKKLSINIWMAIVLPNIFTYLLFPISWDFLLPYSTAFLVGSSVFIIFHCLYLGLLIYWMKEYAKNNKFCMRK